MKERIVDILKVGPRDVFHFANSLRPFIIRGDRFINVEEDEEFLLEDLENMDLMFYNDKDDYLFEGVAIFGELSW